MGEQSVTPESSKEIGQKQQITLEFFMEEIYI